MSGEAFTLHEDAAISVTGDGLILENGMGGIDLHFTLLEADGVTPVQILDATPEPGTLGTIALAFCFGGSALLRWRKRSRRVQLIKG
jgi:hypothetical protein